MTLPNEFGTLDPAKILDKLYGLLPGAILLSWPLGKKGGPAKWASLTYADTQTPEYRAKLLATIRAGGNIGVVLGPASRGLRTIDIDEAWAAEWFRQNNPWIKTTLISRGKRGYQIWFYCDDCPKSQGVFNLRDDNGDKYGEFRAGENGAAVQSIIFGQHPFEQTPPIRYFIENLVAATNIPSFNDIAWPGPTPGLETRDEFTQEETALKVELLHVEELPPEPPPVVLDGLIREAQVLLMGGHSKKWKSYALRDMYFCVSNGFPWLCFESPRRCGVVDIDLECEDWDLRRRYSEIREAYGCGDFDSLRIVPMRGKILSLADLALLPEKLRALGYPISLLGIDPVYRLLSGRNSESDPAVVTEMMNRFLAIAKELDSSVASSHHFSKGGQDQKEAIDRFSGTGVWGRHPDALLTFTQHAKEDCFTVNVELRSFKKPDPFVVHWQYPRFVIDKDADPEDLKKPKAGRPKKSKLEDLCNLIPGDQTVTYTDLWTRAQRALDISQKTFDRRLKDGKDRKWIYRTPSEEYGVTVEYLKTYRQN